ncbi:MAG: ChbG/HpnK family deacetylase [Syntrophomonas sp.]|uniref:ChbG/HpnK family deacetylase n=1 Tax=Syntrophomonas sp. TaxID=2053627 RepID=UPI00260505E4|nr:ChbG/HpnK family deacetylase [Syntrophomonas sp.]MDD3878987.1 ChbG/HpnK family deacetylase [Syntrophomonas sp.]MDD4627044.1 ChbG/HpnK family deacetylase [Syntrophomonas sp.]
MKKYLIINADDFGLSPGVNRAIGELHQARVVFSATLMVNMPGFEEAVALVRQCLALGVGLHPLRQVKL